MGSHSRLQELFFVATFAQPQLSFVCNHEAILYLTIKEGHYNLDYKKAPTGGRAEGCVPHPVSLLSRVTKSFFLGLKTGRSKTLLSPSASNSYEAASKETARRLEMARAISSNS